MTASNINWILPLVAFGLMIVLLSPKFNRAPLWRATLTPLASIIGSGFLVIAPLLGNTVGSNAVWAILGIVVFAYYIGSVVRFNIRHAEPLLNAGQGRILLAIERVSNVALTMAYVVSVAFYIRLLASFVLRILDLHSELGANWLTTAILLFIGFVGWSRGLRGLEALESYAVTIKLSIIAALLIGLADYDFFTVMISSEFTLEPRSKYETLRVLAGVLLVVQGFETSRYLGNEYSADLRIKSMHIAQLLSAVIYVGFVWLITPLLPLLHSQAVNETSIIDLVGHVSIALPVMLVIAAVMSQFSAAVADTLGAAGLVVEESNEKISKRASYLILITFAITLIWVANVFEIITLASRAFAFYYLAQTLVAMLVPRIGSTSSYYICRQFALGILALVLLWVVVFAKAVA